MQNRIEEIEARLQRAMREAADDAERGAWADCAHELRAAQTCLEVLVKVEEALAGYESPPV